MMYLIESLILLMSVFAPAGVGRGLSPMAQRLEAEGYVNIADIDPLIRVDLMYARDDNFVGENMYGDFTEGYLHPDAAEALGKAQELLRKERPWCTLLVKDASRPMRVQQLMWDAVKATPMAPYVSNPANGGGMHNYGVAVDITIVDLLGRELPMGTPVDHLGYEANITREAELVASGAITAEERDNRLLLRRIMQQAGFRPNLNEWWHFNLVDRPTARARYKVIE